MIIGLALGILNNIFITFTLAIVSFGLTWAIFHYSNIYKQGQQNKYFVLHWLFFGGMWLSITLSMLFGWLGLTIGATIFFYAAVVGWILESVLTIIFILSYFYPDHSRKLLIGGGVFSVILMVTCFILGITYDGLTTWNNQFFISTLFLYIYAIIIFIPIVIGALAMLVHELLHKNSDKNQNRGVWFNVVPLLVIFYSILVFFDFSAQLSGVGVVVLRLVLLSFVFLVFITLLHTRLKTYNLENGFTVKIHLMVKAVLYSVLTTILPLIVAAVLLTYSFNSIIKASPLLDLAVSAQDIKQQIIMTAIIVGVLSFFVSILAIRSIENRIKLIIQGMYEVLNNNFQYRVKEAGVYDELGSLGLSFNDMAEDLSQYAGEIDHYGKLLEEKVMQRTDELKNKSKQTAELLEEIKLNSERLNKRTGTITNQMQDGLLVLDHNKDVLRFNKAFLEEFRLNEVDIEGKNLKDLPMIKNYPDMEFMVNRIIEEHLETSQQKIQLKPPLSGLLQCHLTTFEVEEGQHGVIIMMRDIAPPWGIVYESGSMEPLQGVVVRLYNEANDKIIAEEHSDEVGRFMFYVEPGRYYIRLFKDGYHFPSRDANGYHGEVIEIKSKEEGIIHFDIMMDKI